MPDELKTPIQTDPSLALLEAQLTAAEAELPPEPAEETQSKEVSTPSAEAKAPPTLEATAAPPAKVEIGKAEALSKEAPAKETKFAKERARQENQWQKIHQTKAQLETREREIAQREARLNQRERGPAAPAAHGLEKYSRADYERAATAFARAADDLEAQGQFEAADEKRSLASLAKKAAANAPETITPAAAAAPEANAAQLEASQKQSWARAKTEFPDALKADSPLNKGLLAFIRENPEIMDHPNGPYLATKYVRGELSLSEMPKIEALTKENEGLKAKVAEYEKALSLNSGGGQGQPAGLQRWEDMTTEQQEQSLRQELKSA